MTGHTPNISRDDSPEKRVSSGHLPPFRGDLSGIRPILGDIPEYAELASLFSDGSSDFISPLPPHTLNQKVEIRVRVLAAAHLRDIQLRIFPDGEERLLRMRDEVQGPFRVWRAETVLTRLPFTYRFRIQTEQRIFWYNASGLHAHMPPDEEDFRLVPGFSAPAWLHSTVFYQIFPDRFRRGHDAVGSSARTRSPAFTPAVVKEWDAPLSTGRSNFGHEFYGGDLQGVREMLPHLEGLGVNGLYFTPIFESPSNHRYDTTNYDRVDPFLGGNEALADLSESLQARGMRYILDGVFNHAGVNHAWFQDAATRADSPFREYFTFPAYPREYVSWLGHKNLPKFDYASEKLCDAMFRSPDSIARRWLRAPYSASGWRLDAPNMLGRHGTDEGNLELWQAFRKSIKTEYPDAWLVGECFPEATRWLQGDTFDSVMNYRGFTNPMIQWLSGADLHGHPGQISAHEAATWMTSVMARVPFELRNLQYNALSSHDIIRFISRVNGNEDLYRLAVVLQMAFPGVPAIYYGEELAMTGGKDPDNRRPMAWNTVSRRRDLLEFLSRIIGLRRSLRVLRRGAFRFLTATDDGLAFARFEGGEVLIAAANRAPRPLELTIPVGILGLVDGMSMRSIVSVSSAIFVENGQLRLMLSPCEAVWLVQEERS
ncbi:MAG: alpha-amylase family glycosyl hydrolase [Candidatus Ozemobacteraceae bacterium]